MTNTNTTTAVVHIGEVRTIGGHTITVESYELDASGAARITRANVLGAKGEFLGMIGGSREDGTDWMIAAGSGWISRESADDIYDAVARVVELRTQIDAQVKVLHRTHRDCGKRARPAVLDMLRAMAANTAEVVASQAAKVALFDIENPAYAGPLCPIAVRQGRL